jgi:acetolactate decarboxylase
VPQLSVDIPASLKAALDRGAAQCELSTSAVVIKPLSRYLEHPIHTVFQVSTSDALVAGVYDREVSVQAIPEHGNFGLGTFADLGRRNGHTRWASLSGSGAGTRVGSGG